MWLTPWRSSTSRVRSASAWLAWASAAPPKSVTVLWCPVRPNARRSIMWARLRRALYLAGRAAALVASASRGSDLSEGHGDGHRLAPPIIGALGGRRQQHDGHPRSEGAPLEAPRAQDVHRARPGRRGEGDQVGAERLDLGGDLREEPAEAHHALDGDVG